jgi:uncharacterized protein
VLKLRELASFCKTPFARSVEPGKALTGPGTRVEFRPMKAFTPVAGLEVRSSAIHARGCFATRPIKRGTWILEYDGRRLSVKEAYRLYHDRPSTYLFLLEDGLTAIDGISTASLVNHSCEPNCRAVESGDRVYLVAIRNIAAEEELTYDYHLENSNEHPMPCFCGSKKCRGTMFSNEELAGRRKLGLKVPDPPRKAARPKSRGKG